MKVRQKDHEVHTSTGYMTSPCPEKLFYSDVQQIRKGTWQSSLNNDFSQVCMTFFHLLQFCINQKQIYQQCAFIRVQKPYKRVLLSLIPSDGNSWISKSNKQNPGERLANLGKKRVAGEMFNTKLPKRLNRQGLSGDI